MRKMELVEKTDFWIVPIEGREVTRCYIDYSFGIELWLPGDPVVIRINETFYFIAKDVKYMFVPFQEPEAVGPILSILHKTIEYAKAYKDGRLELKFSDESLLSVPVNVKYEAWEINATNGLRLICLPGGGLTIWPPA